MAVSDVGSESASEDVLESSSQLEAGVVRLSKGGEGQEGTQVVVAEESVGDRKQNARHDHGLAGSSLDRKMAVMLALLRHGAGP
jgi:hypothetical protein